MVDHFILVSLLVVASLSFAKFVCIMMDIDPCIMDTVKRDKDFYL